MDTIKFLEQEGIIWNVEKSSKYHPLLSSGRHSNMYVNCNKIFENPNTALMIMREFDKNIMDNIKGDVNTICGLQTGGIILAHYLPMIFKRFNPVKIIFTNKDKNHMVDRWNIDEVKTPVLLVDDVITVGSNLSKCVSNYNGDIFYDKIICVVNRSGSDTIFLGGKKFTIVSAIEMEGESWDADSCHLCKNGSIAIKPKVRFSKC